MWRPFQEISLKESEAEVTSKMNNSSSKEDCG